MSSQSGNQLSAHDALHLLERFLDPPLDEFERARALDDPQVSTSLGRLYERLCALEADECLEEWEEVKHEREIASLIRETQHADWPAAEGELDAQSG